MVQMKVSGLPRLEGMQSEAQRAAQSDRSAGCLFVDSEIHQAVSHWLHVSAQDVEEAWRQLAQDQGCHARARQSLMSTTNFLKQKASLVRLLGSLSQLNLKPLRRPEIFENFFIFLNMFLNMFSAFRKFFQASSSGKKHNFHRKKIIFSTQ